MFLVPWKCGDFTILQFQVLQKVDLLQFWKEIIGIQWICSPENVAISQFLSLHC